jgi:hypothetical protein
MVGRLKSLINIDVQLLFDTSQLPTHSSFYYKHCFLDRPHFTFHSILLGTLVWLFLQNKYIVDIYLRGI